VDRSIIDDIVSKAVSAEDLSSGRKTDKTSSAPARGNRSYYQSMGKKKPLLGRKTGKPMKQEEYYSYGGIDDYNQSTAHARHADEDIKNYRKYVNPKEASMKSIINEIINKAVYGVGASGGKVQHGSGKDESKPSAVKKPELSEERKKQIIEGARTKASHLASSTGMHGLAAAAKIKAEKSLDERTADLVKSLYDVVNHKRFSKMDPDAGINKKKEAAMEHGPTDKGKYVPGSKTYNNPQDSQDPKIRYKSLDERTCDLTKDMSHQRAKEIHDAVSTVRMVKEDIPEAAKMDVNPDDVHRAFSLHSNLTKPQTQKSICDKWQTESAFITKGARVMPLGPGGEVSTLAKDDADRQHPSNRTPSYHQTDTKQFDVESGKVYREQKAKKRVAALKEEQDFGAE